jgi:uncharacterized protein (DUF697 family)
MSTIDNSVEQRQQANDITLRRTLYAAGVGLIPVPVLDAAALLSVQVLMIRDLAHVYGTEFKEQRVRSLVTTLVGDAATVGVFKFIPGIGTFFGGLSGAAVGAAATYALGKLFTLHFAQGGTLLTLDPIKSRAFFKIEFEKGTELVNGLKRKANDKELSIHDMMEQNKALSAEILAFQQVIAAAHGQKIGAPTLVQVAVSIDLDDLKIIEGVGPKVATALKAGGIKNLQDLAASTPEAITAILEKAKGNFNLVVPDSWPEQAALAVKGDLEALKLLQTALIAGRETTS